MYHNSSSNILLDSAYTYNDVVHLLHFHSKNNSCIFEWFEELFFENQSYPIHYYTCVFEEYSNIHSGHESNDDNV